VGKMEGGSCKVHIVAPVYIYRTSLVSGEFSPEMKTLDCVMFNAKQQQLFAPH
jgi:hypothetical protein